MADSARISPTAHYTAYVWYLHGMSHPALSTTLGASLHAALRPMNLGYSLFGNRPNLDEMLLARHRVLDHLLERHVAAGRVRQVVEVAAGLSPRGFTFAQRHPRLLYVEADLPDMAAEKSRRLSEAGLLGPNHRVVVVDALAERGPCSLAALALEHLDSRHGTAIITEGLLGYFDLESVCGMWRRFATALRRFPRGVYLCDLNFAGDVGGMRTAQVFRTLLSIFARGQVHLHFDAARDAVDALKAAGFDSAKAHLPDDFPELDVPARDRGHVVRLLEARVARRRAARPRHK